jgi:hypothetical protein
MVKYYVEGNIDFFTELYKSLDIEEDNIKTEKDNELCLITNLPLVDKYVTLKCGHKFNYIPLYNDLLNYNNKYIYMESNKYGKTSIRCPYCRKDQTELLPYYEELGLKKIMGINSFETCENDHCEFIKEYIINGAVKKEQCKKLCSRNLCYYNIPNCSKLYCNEHKKKVFNEYKKNLINEKKQNEKEEKMKLKQEEKMKKHMEKQKQAEEKKKKKKESSQIHISDISDNIVINENVCCIIIKSGKNKGTQCGCKIYENNICKRHYTLQNKSKLIEGMNINEEINNEEINNE